MDPSRGGGLILYLRGWGWETFKEMTVRKMCTIKPNFPYVIVFTYYLSCLTALAMALSQGDDFVRRGWGG